MARNEVKVLITGDADRLRTALVGANTSLGRFGDDVDAHGGKWDGLSAKVVAFGKVAAVGLAVAGVAAAKWGLDAARSAADYGESLNKLNVLLGTESSDSIIKWGEQNVKTLGMSKKAVADAAGNYSLFANAAGLSGDQARFFTQSLVQLTSDMGSFNNASIEETTEAIGAALRGESEPIRRFGVLLDDATLKQRYFAMTGEEVTGSLTPQQRTLAAYNEILAQTTLQQGDFARTQDSMPNRLKQVEAQYENLRIQVGEKLLPILVELLNWFVEDAWPWLETNIPKFKRWWDETITPMIEKIRSFVQSVQFALALVNNAWFNLFAQLVLIKIRIVDAWQGIVDFITGVPWRVAGALSGMFGPVLPGLFGAINAIYGGWNSAVGFIAGLPGRIIGVFSGAGGWLIGAGRAIMDGLLDGIRAAWRSVESFVGGIADRIRSLKGPLEKDKVLLVQEGRAIMAGLEAGMRAGLVDVERLAAGVAPSISANVSTSAATAPVAAGAVGAVHVHFHGPVSRDGEAWVLDVLARANRRGLANVGGVPS